MTLTNVMLNETRQTQESKYHLSDAIYVVQKLAKVTW